MLRDLHRRDLVCQAPRFSISTYLATFTLLTGTQKEIAAATNGLPGGVQHVPLRPHGVGTGWGSITRLSVKRHNHTDVYGHTSPAGLQAILKQKASSLPVIGQLPQQPFSMGGAHPAQIT